MPVAQLQYLHLFCAEQDRLISTRYCYYTNRVCILARHEDRELPGPSRLLTAFFSTFFSQIEIFDTGVLSWQASGVDSCMTYTARFSRSVRVLEEGPSFKDGSHVDIHYLEKSSRTVRKD